MFLSTLLSAIPFLSNSKSKLSDEVSRKGPFFALVRAVRLAY